MENQRPSETPAASVPPILYIDKAAFRLEPEDGGVLVNDRDMDDRRILENLKKIDDLGEVESMAENSLIQSTWQQEYGGTGQEEEQQVLEQSLASGGGVSDWQWRSLLG